MPILSHSKSGLIIDVFGDRKEILNVEHFVLKNNILLYSINKTIYKYDLLNNTVLLSENFDFDIYELKISNNGSFVVLLKNGNLFLFINNKLCNEFKKVSAFELSDFLLAYENDTSFILYDLINHSIMYKTLYWYKSFDVLNDFCLITTDKCNKDQNYKILKIDKSGEQIIYTFKSLVETKCKYYKNYILFNVATSYVKNSYYASTILFLFDMEKNTFDRVGKINNIQDFTFLKNGFCVIYGNQPTDVIIYNFKLEIINKFPKGIRNRIYFNEYESYVAMAGFDQLAGDIELWEVNTKKKLNLINELGANRIEWEKNGSYFYVSTFKLLKDDNRIVKYDYYGNKIQEEKYEVLHDSIVYGKIDKFLKLNEENKIKKTSSNIYVPSCLKNNSRPKINNHINKDKPKKIKETKEELEKKLSKILELKNRIKNKEKLTTEEMNLILNEDKIKNEINKRS